MLPPVGRNWQLIDPNWCLLCQRRFIELGAEPIRVCINLTLSAQWSSNQDIKEKMHCLHQPPFRAQWSCNINIKITKAHILFNLTWENKRGNYLDTPAINVLYCPIGVTAQWSSNQTQKQKMSVL
jgi:hypothetical protein